VKCKDCGRDMRKLELLMTVDWHCDYCERDPQCVHGNSEDCCSACDDINFVLIDDESPSDGVPSEELEGQETEPLWVKHYNTDWTFLLTPKGWVEILPDE